MNRGIFTEVNREQFFSFIALDVVAYTRSLTIADRTNAYTEDGELVAVMEWAMFDFPEQYYIKTDMLKYLHD